MTILRLSQGWKIKSKTNGKNLRIINYCLVGNTIERQELWKGINFHTSILNNFYKN